MTQKDDSLPSRRLIINADDLGSGCGRDAGIFSSFTAGIVTSASLLANGPTTAAAAASALSLALPLGVHLNLSDGFPLGGPIPGLTTSAGAFPGKAGLRSFLAGAAVDPLPLRCELAAQIAAVAALGIVLDHLDTHQHFFLYPALTAVILDLAREHAIGALRLPLPGEEAAAEPGGALGAELALYRCLAPAALARVRESGLPHPDGLLGMPLLNRLDEKSLLAALRALPLGSWEVMVHPGYSDPADPFGGVEREVELAALTSPLVAAELRRCNITPITFRELSCAS